ncbi:MAG: hypothetical protein K0Q63_2558, partial [Paenibacillus sp.]|nr:hypothetical protein [Paenibacillus sp.]
MGIHFCPRSECRGDWRSIVRRWMAYVLVLAGILIIAYPKASEWYNDRQQEKL